MCTCLYINEDGPLVFTEGDTAYGVQINEPWSDPVTSCVFHISTLTTLPVQPVTPFNGQSAVVTQTAGPPALTTFQYSWPSALPAGIYACWFIYTLQGGRPGSTGRYVIEVRRAI